MKKLKVGIIGCGNIGSLWDETNRDPAFPKTHAYSVLQDPNLELTALCDKNPERLSTAGSIWGITQTFWDPEAFFVTKPDIIGICTPTAVNKVPLVESAVRNGVKGILCEKPASTDVTSLLRMRALCEEAGTHLMVNYIRRFDPGLAKARTFITNGTFGKTQKVVCHYGKGILNNGSHILDLLHWYFGEPQDARYLGQVSDPWESDPTVNALITYQKDLPVFVTAQSSEHYSLFEIDIFLTGGRVRILEGGRKIEVYQRTRDPDFPDYSSLALKEVFTEGLRSTIPGAFANLRDLVRGKTNVNQSPLDGSITNLQTILKLIH